MFDKRRDALDGNLNSGKKELMSVCVSIYPS